MARLTFRPTDADIVDATYTTFGGHHVFESSTAARVGGQSTATPPRPARHPGPLDPRRSYEHRRLLIGTDLEVLVSTRDGRRWAVENSGFSNAVTESLSWVEGGDGRGVLFAFTRGRGAWRVDVAP